MANVLIDESLISKSSARTVDYLVDNCAIHAYKYLNLYKDKYEKNENIAFDFPPAFSKDILKVFNKNLNRENSWYIKDLNNGFVNKEVIDITFFNLEKKDKESNETEFLRVKGFLFTNPSNHTIEEREEFEGIKLEGNVSAKTLKLVAEAVNSYEFEKLKFKPLDLSDYGKEAGVELPKSWREEWKEVIDVCEKFGMTFYRFNENKYSVKDNISDCSDVFQVSNPKKFVSEIRDLMNSFDVKQSVDLTVALYWEKDGYYDKKGEPYIGKTKYEDFEKKINGAYSGYKNRLNLIADNLEEVFNKKTSKHNLRSKKSNKVQKQESILSH